MGWRGSEVHQFPTGTGAERQTHTVAEADAGSRRGRHCDAQISQQAQLAGRKGISYCAACMKRHAREYNAKRVYSIAGMSVVGGR